MSIIKKAFCMYVYPDKHEEYKKRHDLIWPEMTDMLKEYGALSYSIFLDKDTSVLYAYLEIESEEKWSQVAKTPLNQKWWDYMADVMKTNPDNSPVTKDLDMVFNLT